MNEGGVLGRHAAEVIGAGALCGIAVGTMIAFCRAAHRGVVAGFVVTVLYAVIGTILMDCPRCLGIVEDR